MTSPSSNGTAPVSDFADLQARLIDYASRIGELRTPHEVLDSLHVITTKSLPLGVLAAIRLGVRAKGTSTLQLGKSVFLQEEAQKGWGEEYEVLARKRDSPMALLGMNGIAIFTWTD